MLLAILTIPMLNAADFRAAAQQGKTGLALSGGGLRASLFHIGMLARLAELDLLRFIDVISTVSGGSIIGAYYYLKVKQLLEGKRPDKLAPDRDAYIRLIQEIEVDFLHAVQQNMRMRTFLDRRKNARMLRETFSPTDRMAELYTEHFYARIQGTETGLFLRDLPIQPAVFAEGETIRKAPKLIINATALNTGHLWQFTGLFIGEVISRYEQHYARMPTLPKLYFADPELLPLQRYRLSRLTLGQAVAASCGVPGLFDPLSLAGLYKTDAAEDIVIRLADGGVFDNQGIISLFNEDCEHIICSDASDILKPDRNPSNRLVNVAIRANEIMMDRIRNKVLDYLFARPPDTYAFFHLGAPVGPEVFPYEADRFVYGLSHIRTDLDAFTDREAYTLMYYGYRLADAQFQGEPATPAQWRFLVIRDFLHDEQQRAELLLHLEVGAKQLFKVFFLKRSMPYAIVGAALSFPVGLVGLALYLLPPLASLLLALSFLSVVAYSQNARINQYLDRVKWLRWARRRLALALAPLGIPALLGLIGAGVSWIQLRVFDRLFLRYGRIDPDRIEHSATPSLTADKHPSQLSP